MSSEGRKMTLAERIAGFFNRDSKTIKWQADQIQTLKDENEDQAATIRALTSEVSQLKGDKDAARAMLAEIETVVNAHAHAGQGTEDG